MICELCGRFVKDGNRIRIEGGTVLACSSCTGAGEVVCPVGYPKKKKTFSIKAEPTPEQPPEEFVAEEEYELVDDYGRIVKNAREKLGLKQEEFAKRINEPASLVHKIESSRTPLSPSIGRKIERALNIRIYAKKEDSKSDLPNAVKKNSGVLTLGDVIVVKKRGK